MSSAIVPISRVSEILPHPDPEVTRLEIVRLEGLGYQLVAQKGNYEIGQVVIYFPPDTMISRAWAQQFGVEKYLSWRKDDDTGEEWGRVRGIKLKKEPSYGFTVPLDGNNHEGWLMYAGPGSGFQADVYEADVVGEVGDNVANVFDAKKWTPSLSSWRKGIPTDAVPRPDLVPKYTDIENMRLFTDVIKEGEEVVITEKIHGTCAQVAGVWEPDMTTDPPGAGESWNLYVGCGKGLLRKQPDTEEACSVHWYWHITQQPGVIELLYHLRRFHRQVILFGETFGPVQKLTYGYNTLQFRVFDIMVDGKYMDWDMVTLTCSHFGVPTVPELWRGPFNMAKVKQLANGPTYARNPESTVTHIREGVVVHPLVERTDPKIGRVILKYVSDNYLTGEYAAEEVGEE